jgi:hypothetical protein
VMLVVGMMECGLTTRYRVVGGMTVDTGCGSSVGLSNRGRL